MSDFTGVISEAMSQASSEPAAPPAATPEPTSDASASVAEPSASLTATPAPAAATPPEPGPVPYPRFHEVNEERSRFKADLDKLAWARSIPETQAPVIAEFYQRFAGDPMGTLLGEVEAIAQADPRYAQAVKSAAARWLGANRQARDLPMPEPDLETQDGRPLYSAAQAQKLMEWRESRLQQQMAKQVQPLEQFVKQAQIQQVRGEIQQQAQSWAQQTFNEWKGKPHFVEYKAQIAQLMQERNIGLGDAYAEVLVTQVLPKLSAQERSAVVAQMQTKAAAGTASPARTPAASAQPAKTFGAELARLASLPG